MAELFHTNQQLQDLLALISADGTVTSNSEKDIGVVDRMMYSLYRKSSSNMKDQLNDINTSISDVNQFNKICNSDNELAMNNKWAIEHAVSAAYLSAPPGDWPVNPNTNQTNIIGQRYTAEDVSNVRSLMSALTSALPAKFSEAVCRTLGTGRIENGVTYFDEAQIATSQATDDLKLRSVLNGLDSINALSTLATDVFGTWSAMAMNDILTMMNSFEYDAAKLQLMKDLLVQQNLLVMLCRILNNVSTVAPILRQKSHVGNQETVVQQQSGVQINSLNDSVSLINTLITSQAGWTAIQPQAASLLQLLAADELQALVNILSGYNISAELKRINDRNTLNAIMLAINADTTSGGVNVTAIEQGIVAGAIVRNMNALPPDVFTVLQTNQFINWLVYNINTVVDLQTAMRCDVTRGTQVMTILYSLVNNDHIAGYLGTSTIPNLMMNRDGVIEGYRAANTNYSGSYPTKDVNAIATYLQSLNIGLANRPDVVNSDHVKVLAAVLSELMTW